MISGIDEINQIGYSSNWVEIVTGVPRGRFKSWILAGDIVPGLEIAKGRGRHLYNYRNLYEIKLYDDLVSSGWKREIVGQFFSTIKPGIKKKLFGYAFGDGQRFNLMRTYLYYKIFSPQLWEKIFYHGWVPDLSKVALHFGSDENSLINRLNSVAESRFVYLAFVRFRIGEEFYSYPLLDVVPTNPIDGIRSQVMDLLHHFSTAADIYIHNFSETMAEVDSEAFFRHPVKVSGLFTAELQKFFNCSQETVEKFIPRLDHTPQSRSIQRV